jgi:8-oxo-dGTP pyrophosphatase MutT (NUDIX family)
MPKASSPRARREVSAGGVAFRLTREGPRFLLIRAGGRWSFPKGNVEKEETPERAALREIAEETGLRLEDLHLRSSLPLTEYVFRWEGRLVFKTVHNFLVEARGDGRLTPQASEVEEASWFSAEEARRSLSFKNNLPTLEAAIAAVASLEVRP